jgi:hypothetical protein
MKGPARGFSSRAYRGRGCGRKDLRHWSQRREAKSVPRMEQNPAHMASSTMIPNMLTLKITRRDDGRYVTQQSGSSDGPLGVDADLNQALGTAVREATRISREAKCRVAIDVELANGNFRRDQIVNPPLRIRRVSKPA